MFSKKKEMLLMVYYLFLINTIVLVQFLPLFLPALTSFTSSYCNQESSVCVNLSLQKERNVTDGLQFISHKYNCFSSVFATFSTSFCQFYQ
jgi:hypothetical protein